MSDVKFSLKEWEKWLGKLTVEDAALRGLRSGAHRAIPVLHRATDNAPPASPNGRRGASNTGHYRRSWSSESITRGISLFNKAPYSPIIEGGRRKGLKMPPVKPLARWAQRRLGLSSKEAQGVGFAIALAIKKRGLKPRHVLKNSLAEIRRLMIIEVEHELEVELGTK